VAVPCSCCPLDGCFTINGDPTQPASRFICGGVIRFYDLAGNEVPATSVRACDGASGALPLTDLTFIPFAFGDGPDGLGENLCNFTTNPTALNTWTAQPGGCFDPNVASPSNLVWSVPPMTSLTFEYGNPPRISGGAGIRINSPQLGPANVTWPTVGQRNPGDVVTSNPTGLGHRVRLTYLSGPLGTDPSGSVDTGGDLVFFHRNATIGTAAPIRVRLDFLA
jgi:hypothetical protein